MAEKVLLDTNIIIHRETPSFGIDPNIGNLFGRIDKCGYEKWIHPITISEIEGNKNKKIVELMRNKLNSYQVLKSLSNDTPEITDIKNNDKDINSINDTDILKEVYSGIVDYLITEDKEIHNKAEILGISNKVYDIDSFLEKLMFEKPELNDYKVLSIRKEFFGDLTKNGDFNSPFFDSLRKDYPGFDERIKKKSQEPAYVYRGKEDKVQGFLYLKVENENDYGDIFPKLQYKKCLKIGTFKVDSPGNKLGERFLKIAFDNAIEQNVEAIYLTIFKNDEGKERLISLIENRGFSFHGTKGESGKELVYVRNFSKKFNKDDPSKTFPFISKSNKIFICSIYPEYHTKLFPDSILITEDPNNFVDNQPYSNAIKKIFISWSINRNLNSGDLILFYRTGGFYKGVITTIGIVENIVDGIRSEDEFIRLCQKRTVFNELELKEHWNYRSSPPFIINFLYTVSLKNKINLKRLIELGIIKDINSVPRGFEEISKEQFDLFIKESRLNESYIVD